jgi:hypothetical protein
MYGCAERWARWSQSEVVLHNQTNRLCSVNRLARGAPWSVYALHTFARRLSTDPVIWRDWRVIVFYIWINIILLLFWIWFDSNLNWAIRIPCLSVFCVGDHIRVWILLCFIILFYLASLFEISVCSKGLSLLDPIWYRESRDAVLWPLFVTE